MIQITTYDPASGRITATKDLIRADQITANVPEGQGWVEGYHDAEREYWDGTGMAPRPVVLPMTGATYDLSTLTADLVVVDEYGTETRIPAQPDTLQLQGPGKFRVRSTEPFPAVNFDVEVTL